LKTTPKKPRAKRNEIDPHIKEVLTKSFPELVKRFLQTDISSFKEANTEISRSIRRHTDFLYHITDSKEANLMLHVEYQAKFKADMAARMLEYYSLVHIKEGLPILQYVFYSEEKNWEMTNSITHPSLQFSFQLVNLRTIDYTAFLENQNADFSVLAVLADFKNEPVAQVLRKIAQKVPDEFIETFEAFCLNRKITTHLIETIIMELRSIKPEQSFFYRKAKEEDKIIIAQMQAREAQMNAEKAQMQAEINKLKAELAKKK
jgi:Putative transposase, YhgA-like